MCFSSMSHTLQWRDIWDRVHVGLGGEFVPPQFRHFYKGNLITGVFSPKTNVKGTAEARDRLHFIGFVNERSYQAGAFGPFYPVCCKPAQG
jgi:hypothetical protein